MTDRLSTPATPAPPGSDAEIRARKTAAAKRALAEAKARRAATDAQPPLPKELGGRAGPEPTRYGDWEKKGMICDF